MGAEFFITLEREMPGVDHLGTCGQFLAENIERLDQSAESLGVTPLSSFFSVSELAELLDYEPVEEGDVSGIPEEGQRLIRQLSGDINNAMAEVQESIADLIEAHDGEIPAEQWFPAEQGLKTVRKLLEDVRSRPRRFRYPDDLIADLEDMNRILNAAKDHAVRFHLSADV